MPPDDPLGRNGPTIESFLRKKPLISETKLQQCPYGKRAFKWVDPAFSPCKSTFIIISFLLSSVSLWQERSALMVWSVSSTTLSAPPSHSLRWQMNWEQKVSRPAWLRTFATSQTDSLTITQWPCCLHYPVMSWLERSPISISTLLRMRQKVPPTWKGPFLLCVRALKVTRPTARSRARAPAFISVTPPSIPR